MAVVASGRTGSMALETWGRLILESLLQPRDAARKVLAVRVGFDALLEAALAVTCIGMVLAFIAVRLSPGALDPSTTFVLANPLLGAAFQLCVLAAVVGGIVHVGRFFGGKGGVTGALATVVWLDFVMLLIQALQIGAIVLVPPIATFLSIAAVIWVIWAMACFVSELHGFQNPIVVMGGVVLSMAVLFFGIALVLTFIGAPLEGAG